MVHTEFKDSQGYMEKLYLKRKKEQKQNKTKEDTKNNLLSNKNLVIAGQKILSHWEFVLAFERRSHYVVKLSLEFKFLLSQHPKYEDYWHLPRVQNILHRARCGGACL